jgi:hypothetical protein
MNQEEIIFRALIVRGYTKADKHLLIWSSVAQYCFVIIFFILSFNLIWDSLSFLDTIRGRDIELLARVASLLIFASIISFWALSYIPKEVMLYKDRMVIKMYFKKRVIPFSKIKELKALEPEEVKKKKFSFHPFLVIFWAINTKNAVLISCKWSFPYIINPENREEFLQAFSRVFSEYFS